MRGKISSIVIAGFVVVAVAGCAATTNTTPGFTPTTQSQPATGGSTDSGSQATGGQEQALQSAQSYLDMGGFSERKLMEQLVSSAGEGFSRADARYAVNHVGADWNQQAVEAAKSYLSMGGFSRQGLMDQLTSSAGEGFTQAQASYAVSKVYP